MFINDKHVCSSDAVYGMRTDADAMGGHGHPESGGKNSAPAAPAAAIKTISSMTICTGPIPVKKGDSMKLIAEYDLSKHPLRQSSSGAKAADVMGMMGVAFAAAKK
jgi:hypothetical protein